MANIQVNIDIADEELYVANIENLKVILACKEAMKDKDYDASTLYTWNNAKNKDDDYFTVNFNDVDINDGKCQKQHGLQHIQDAEAEEQLMPLAIKTALDIPTLQRLGGNAKDMALPDSARIIAEEVIKLAKKS